MSIQAWGPFPFYRGFSFQQPDGSQARYLVGAGTGSRRSGDSTTAKVDVPGTVFPECERVSFDTPRLQVDLNAQVSQMMQNIDDGIVVPNHTDGWSWGDLHELMVYYRRVTDDSRLKVANAIYGWTKKLGAGPVVTVKYVAVDHLPSAIDVEARPTFHQVAGNTETYSEARRIVAFDELHYGIGSTNRFVNGAFLMVEALSDAGVLGVAAQFDSAFANLQRLLSQSGGFACVIDVNLILSDMADLAAIVGPAYKRKLDELGLIPVPGTDPRPTRTTVSGKDFLPPGVLVGIRAYLPNRGE